MCCRRISARSSLYNFGFTGNLLVVPPPSE
nr:MAG TPA: hypothetical protein [Caudoviricetes sp.]